VLLGQGQCHRPPRQPAARSPALWKIVLRPGSL
jgi:hypothetical protein